MRSKIHSWLLRGASLVLVVVGALSIVRAADETTQDVISTTRQSDSVVLSPTVTSGTMEFVIDDVEHAIVIVTCSSKTLDVSLTDPSATTTSVGSMGPGITGSMEYPEGADLDPTILGKDYAFKLENPEPGTWTVNVAETVALIEDLPVVVNVWMTSAVQAFAVGGGEDYPLGSAISLGVYVTDDTGPLAGYTIDADVSRPFDATFTPVALSFADDGVSPDFAAGDGLYSSSITLLEAGDYAMRATLSGMTAGGLAFEREVFAEFRVIEPVASLVPVSVSDAAIDPDLDTLLDGIAISIDVDSSVAGDFTTLVELETIGGTIVSRASMDTLPIGISTVEIDFDTGALTELGEDGPYQIRKVQLEQVTADDNIINDIQYDLGSTAAYSLADLEREPIIVTDFRETPSDCDSDGDFDSLNIEVDFDIVTPGVHSYSMSLYDAEGREIKFLSGAANWSTGVNTLSFDFDAYLITARGGDGPYTLGSALVIGPADAVVLGGLGSTAPYLQTDFQFAPTTIPFADDFESRTLGPISGQGGWTQTAGADPNSAVVGTSAPVSGAQGLELSRDAALGDAMPWGVFTPLVADDDVEQVVSMSIAFDASGGPSYDVLLQSPSEGNSVAWLRFGADGSLSAYQAYGAGFEFIDTGYDWLSSAGLDTPMELTIRVNALAIPTQRVVVQVDGVSIFNGPTLGSDFVEQVAILTDNTAPSATCFVDDLTITNRFMRVDCNFNGVPDACDIGLGTATDCNGNGIPDSCDVLIGGMEDCNSNLIPDDCDLAAGTSLDCNGNSIPDECDIASGLSEDCNGNGVPDQCDFDAGTSLDCNLNGLPDECDIASGFSIDCDGNGVPDDCDLAAGTAQDCNGNSIPDSCDFASGVSLDCNGNGLPDECDIDSGASLDLDFDGQPDECEDFIRGDSNADGNVEISDALLELDYLAGAATTDCLDAFDTNDDGAVNIVDPIFLLSYLFSTGATPPAPFGVCGPDMTADAFDPCPGDRGACP